jgi:UDP-N-acetylmuramoyl-tripeptide--D-alanyl-D-alanine ligase
MRLELSEVIGAIGGRTRSAPPPRGISGVSTDSRTLRPDELFFALRGERFDGHAFVEAALRGGAAGAAIADDRADELAAAVERACGPAAAASLIAVYDPLAALGRLGAFHRARIRARVIAVAGSNGKTTTKAMIDHVLSGSLRGRSSPKSFNNAVGVPLTLLSAESGDEYLVVEIGTNAPGEVAPLAALTRPELCVITSIGEEHLEGLGDLDGVAREECSILDALQPGGFAAINIDATEVRAQLEGRRGVFVTFGRSRDADLRVSAVRYQHPWLQFTINERESYRLRMPGHHHALNACGAIAVARRMGLVHGQIAARLESFEGPPMRTELLELNGVLVLNDAYNSNPASAQAAIHTLETIDATGRRIAVIGEMRELGPRTAELHRALAARLRSARIDLVLLVGAAAEWMQAELSRSAAGGPAVACCRDVDECSRRLETLTCDGDVVLLKASRAVGLERAAEALRRRATAAPTA